MPLPTPSRRVATLTLEVRVERIKSDAEPAYTLSSDATRILDVDTVLFTLFYPTDQQHMATGTGMGWLESPRIKSAAGLLKYAGIPTYLAPLSLLPLYSVAVQRVPAAHEAPLADADGGVLPLVLFSHGLGGSRTAYSTFCTSLAAQGAVVAAIEHRDGSASNTNIAPSSSSGSSSGSSTSKIYVRPDEVSPKPADPLIFRREQLVHRQKEVLAVLAVLRRIAAGEPTVSLRSPAKAEELLPAFQGRLDAAAPWMCGHSFGGATAIELVRNQSATAPTFSCAILLDPWVEPVDNEKGVNVPLYTINSEHFTCWKTHMASLLGIARQSYAAAGRRGWLATLGAEPIPPSPSTSTGTGKRVAVVHDMFGTLFSLSSPLATLRSLFADQLRGLPPMVSELIVMDWFHATQRDFTYSCVAGVYRPIGDVFRASLSRVLQQAGMLAPGQEEAGGRVPLRPLHVAGSAAGGYPASVVDAMMASLKRLEPRPGMVEAFERIYRAPGNMEIWAATNGSLELGRGLFERALGAQAGADLSDDRLRGVGLMSCDEIQVAKPDPRVYEAIKARLDASGPGSRWFVASHAWDLFAAKRAGFKTAWVRYEEFDPLPAIFGTPDIIATDMADAAAQIVHVEHTFTYDSESVDRPLATRHTGFSDFPFLLGAKFGGTVRDDHVIETIVDMVAGIVVRKQEALADADAVGEWRVWREGHSAPAPLHLDGEAESGTHKRGRVVLHSIG